MNGLMAICGPILAEVLLAIALLLVLVVVVRRAWQKPGAHRPGRVAVACAPAAPTPAAANVLPFLPALDYGDEPDDWTSYLPTAVIPAVKARVDLPRRMSPSETAVEAARRRWGVECPVFAGLAEDWGYDPIYGLDQARAVA